MKELIKQMTHRIDPEEWMMRYCLKRNLSMMNPLHRSTALRMYQAHRNGARILISKTPFVIRSQRDSRFEMGMLQATEGLLPGIASFSPEKFGL